MRRNRRNGIFVGVALLLSLHGLATAANAAPPADPTLTKARTSVTKGLDYLRRIQEKDGSWGHYPAFTALAVTAFLRNGRTEAKDPAVARGVHALLQSAQKDGGIYSTANPAMTLPNYNTSLSLIALGLTNNPAYRPVIEKAQKFVAASQFDEDEGMTPANPVYGGIGYGSDPDDHPDLSNLQTALEALKTTGESATSPVWQKAIVFLQRVQNRKASNDQAWAKDSPNDGGFAYDSVGQSKVPNAPAHTSMGAMTYAGLKSLLFCGVSKTDPRSQAAWNWIRSHYTTAEHPGMGETSLYYYYMTATRTLALFSPHTLTDTLGKTHVWPREFAAQLVARQHPDGSWFSEVPKYLENQPVLVTSYGLITLSYCLQ